MFDVFIYQFKKPTGKFRFFCQLEKKFKNIQKSVKIILFITNIIKSYSHLSSNNKL